jgi:hypothetical protein
VPSFDSPMYWKTFSVDEVSQYHLVSHLFNLAIVIFLLFLSIFELLAAVVGIVSQYDICDGCHVCDTRPMCHKYTCFVSLVIKCVIGGLLETNFNKVRRVGGLEVEGSKSAYWDFGRQICCRL